jgi:hypothetical protein
MNTEATNDYGRQCSYAVGILESLTMKIRRDYEDVAAGRKQFTWGHVGEMKDICRTLSDIEDRIYSKGEYAPENASPLPPLPLAVITHMKKVSR